MCVSCVFVSVHACVVHVCCLCLLLVYSMHMYTCVCTHICVDVCVKKMLCLFFVFFMFGVLDAQYIHSLSYTTQLH